MAIDSSEIDEWIEKHGATQLPPTANRIDTPYIRRVKPSTLKESRYSTSKLAKFKDALKRGGVVTHADIGTTEKTLASYAYLLRKAGWELDKKSNGYRLIKSGGFCSHGVQRKPLRH